ncbi:hypothetical protein Hamer_G030147 [Homarus americanus]|uniref:Uncharacterized protein n=1 Tax=Homarus americanus TaxID=6706 RepID=A0A8J5JMN5_HOMAM|nr:hypothetical protein Hamer_G030147 [Homarus americanus]
MMNVDTDVVVICIGFATKIGCECLWSFRSLDITQMAEVLGEERYSALPAFHTLTGCDVTSSFAGKG